jgi:hypothetical protein
VEFELVAGVSGSGLIGSMISLSGIYFALAGLFCGIHILGRRKPVGPWRMQWRFAKQLVFP